MDKVNKALRLIDFLANPARDIEVFGMFGLGNLGDEAMLVAARKSLPSRRCVPWQSYNSYPLLSTLIRRRRRKHLLVGGGTLIHGGNTAWLDYIEMRVQQGVKVSFFGTGIAFAPEQISSRSSSYERWCAVLAQSDEIHLRGPYSVDLCQSMCGRGEIFGDFAFLLHRDTMVGRHHSKRDNTIGINVGNCLGNQELFEDAAGVLVKRLSADHRLVFHVVVATDMEATHRVIGRAGLSPGSYEIEEHYFDPMAFMQSIMTYRAFIGLKLHAAGLAMIAGVPTLMIAYLPKCFDFMAPLTASDHMLLDLPLDIEEVITKMDIMMKAPQSFIFESQISAIAARQRNTLSRFNHGATTQAASN